MALAPSYDTLDLIPETARGAYVEKDGKFVLDFDVPDTVGLKNALAAERALNKTAKERAAQLDRLGIPLEEIEQRLADERKKADELAVKAGRFDEILGKKLGDQKLEYDGKLTAAEKREANALNLARNAVMKSDLGAALVKAKASAEGMTALPKLIGDRIKIEFDDEGKVTSQIMEADGATPMVGSGKGGLATYDDLVKAVQQEFPSLFEGMGGGGGKSPNTSGRSGNADLMKLSPMQRMDAARANRK